MSTWELWHRTNKGFATSIGFVTRGSRIDVERVACASSDPDVDFHIVREGSYAGYPAPNLGAKTYFDPRDHVVARAFRAAHNVYGHSDLAACVAVVAGGPGAECMGAFTLYRHTRRGRIRAQDEHGTKTDWGATLLARGHAGPLPGFGVRAESEARVMLMEARLAIS